MKTKVNNLKCEGELTILLGRGWEKDEFMKQVEIDDESIRVITDKEEWESWKKRGDPVLHIELRKKASRLVVFPASLDIVGEFANGLASNLIVRLTNSLTHFRRRCFELGTSSLPQRSSWSWTGLENSKNIRPLKPSCQASINTLRRSRFPKLRRLRRSLSVIDH